MPERALSMPADTEALGVELAATLTAGDLVILDGPLGAGKTVLVRGLARGLGVSGAVTSPTFVIARHHPAGARGIELVHVDAYRLALSTDLYGELDALDLDTDLDAAVVVVEWGAAVVEKLAERHLLVRMHRAPDVETRTAEWAWSARG